MPRLEFCQSAIHARLVESPVFPGQMANSNKGAPCSFAGKVIGPIAPVLSRRNPNHPGPDRNVSAECRQTTIQRPDITQSQ